MKNGCPIIFSNKKKKSTLILYKKLLKQIEIAFKLIERNPLKIHSEQQKKMNLANSLKNTIRIVDF